jgi:CheY-like chemotaxis protein
VRHEFKFEVIPLEQVAPGPDAPTRQGRATVLVVDDEPLIVDTLAAILSSVGLAVLKAYDGPSALQVAIAHSPQLLVADVAVTGKSGIELARNIVDAVPGCRVVLFSGHASMLDLGPARDAGFDFLLLSKPIHASETLRRIFATLRGQATRLGHPESHREEHIQWGRPPVRA